MAVFDKTLCTKKVMDQIWSPGHSLHSPQVGDEAEVQRWTVKSKSTQQIIGKVGTKGGTPVRNCPCFTSITSSVSVSPWILKGGLSIPI